MKQLSHITRCCGLFLLFIFAFVQLKAQSIIWVEPAINLIDGTTAQYNNVHPGDTLFLRTGTRDKLLIRNFTGTADKPIHIMNKDGIVTINTNDYYGISIINCKYIQFSGQGNTQDLYGIQIKKVLAGSGIGIGGMSSDFEIDHISIENCLIGGIYAKTDPDCSFLATRDHFVQYNTHIHDNYIASVGNEGMYIGSSLYAGTTLTCSGKDTMILPPILIGVKIYNNIIRLSGWDAIQVSSAPQDCQIYNNSIYYDSQAEVPNQMTGILMGGGSQCSCYNNFITDGKGDGIENHGLGGNRIFNNIIVNAGKTYFPDDPTKMKHGIFVSDNSTVLGASLYILFNDIINPKSDGIRFQSVKTKNNLIASNLIINPGSYSYYESGNTSFKGKDAYVMIPNASTDVQLKNNYFTRNLQAAGISSNDYTILAGSPLINTAYSDNQSISVDFRNHRRPVGGLFDIGAMEYDGGNDTLLHTFNQPAIVFPNPVSNLLTIRYLATEILPTSLAIYNLSGVRVLTQSVQVQFPGVQDMQIEISQLAHGAYAYTLKNGNETRQGKFVKL